MPVFEIGLNDGRKLRIDAESQEAALAGAQHFQKNDTQPQQPSSEGPGAVGTAEDVVKQVGAAVPQFLAHIPTAGLDLFNKLGAFAQDKVGGDPEAYKKQQELRALVASNPNSFPARVNAVQQGVENMLPKPETEPGAYANAGTKGVLGAFTGGVPGSLPRVAAAGVGAGVGAKAAGDLAQGTGYEEPAALGGAVLGGVAGHSALPLTAAGASGLVKAAKATAAGVGNITQQYPVATGLVADIMTGGHGAFTAAGLVGKALKAQMAAKAGGAAEAAAPAAEGAAQVSPPLPVNTGDIEKTLMATVRGLNRAGKQADKQQVQDAMPLLRELATRNPQARAQQILAQPEIQQKIATAPVDAAHQVKEAAGMQTNGGVAIDRSIPPTAVINGKVVDLHQMAKTHEIVEIAETRANKAKGMSDQDAHDAAHKVATEAEILNLPKGVSREAYQEQWGGRIANTTKQHITDPAPNLDPVQAAAAAAPDGPVLTAKAISKANGKVTTTPPPGSEMPDIPDFLRRAPNSLQSETAKPAWSTPTLTNPYLEHTAVEAQLGPRDAAAHVIENLKARPDYKFTQHPAALMNYLSKVFPQKDAVAKALSELTGDPEQALRGHLYALKTNKEATAWRDQLTKYYGKEKVEAAFPAAKLQSWWRK